MAAAVTAPREDADRLAEAAQEWLARGRDAAQSLLAPDGPLGSAFAHQGPECKVCPICQGIALARSVNPDVLQHLGDALTSLLAALAEVAQAAGPQASSEAADSDLAAGGDTEASSPRRPPRAVQRIEVTGD